jgi:hypothetical protein
MTMADGEGDVFRLTRSFGVRGFRYRSFGNRAVRLNPVVALSAEPEAVAVPDVAEAAPASLASEILEIAPAPAMVLPLPSPPVIAPAPVLVQMVAAAPLPVAPTPVPAQTFAAVLPAPVRQPGTFSLLRQALGEAPAISAAPPPSALPLPPAANPAPGSFALLSAAQAQAGR